eukprot:UN18818
MTLKFVHSETKTPQNSLHKSITKVLRHERHQLFLIFVHNFLGFLARGDARHICNQVLRLRVLCAGCVSTTGRSANISSASSSSSSFSSAISSSSPYRARARLSVIDVVHHILLFLHLISQVVDVVNTRTF